MSCKGILPQTRNGSGQIEDERKKELASPVSYRKNGEFSLAASRTILPDNNQDVAEDGINGENTSSSVLEIATSNYILPDMCTEITSDVGVSVDDWFKTRSEGMDLDSVLITDGIGVNDLEGYHFAPSKDNVDMCIVTNICDMGLGFDLPVNICDKNNQALSECDNECEPTPFLDDFNNSELEDRNLLSKDNSELSEESNLLGSECKDAKFSYVVQSEDKEANDTSGKSITWSSSSTSENVFMKTRPLILSGDSMKWEAQSTVSQQSTDYESEKDDFPEFSLLTFQVDNAEGINVINSLSQMDCVSDDNVVPANIIVSDSSVVSNSVSFTDSNEISKQVVGIPKPRVIRGNKSSGGKIRAGTAGKNSAPQINGDLTEDSVPSSENNGTNVINSSTANPNSALNPRSLLRQTSKASSLKSAIEAESLVKKVSETCNLLPTAVTSETENVVRQGSPAKKAPAMTIIAISTDKSKNTTEIVINTSQGEQKFKGKTSDFIKATSKLFNNQQIKTKIGQSLTLSNSETPQEELTEQQNENEVDWSKYDKSKAADEQPITEALATLGIDLSTVNYVTAGGNSGYKLWQCPTPNCNKLYPRLSLLKVHILTHYGVRPYRCDIPGCQWTFYTFFKLKRHRETHLKRKAFVCPVPSCGHRFTTIYNLKTHRKLHERPAKLQCPVSGCDAHFQTKRAVELHVKKHGISHAPYQCTFAGCGKRYYSSNTLNTHARSHQHREEEVRCQWPDCGKWFDKPCRLKAHMRTHTGDKPYLCTYENCGWAFSSASKLKRHQQKHTNERKFRCSLEGCGKSFMRSEHLKEHVQTHAGERSYQCTVENCGVKFTAKSSLYVHLKKHKQQMKKDPDGAAPRPVTKIQPADNGVTSSSSTAAGVPAMPSLQVQQPQKLVLAAGAAPALAAAAPKAAGAAPGVAPGVSPGVSLPVQVVVPIAASGNSFFCPVESCPKSYSCKASLRQHLLKHHTPVLASDASQLDYITSLLLSGGSNQQVVVSSTEEPTAAQADNLTTIAAVQAPVCTVAVTDVSNIDSSRLLSAGTLFDRATTYPSEYISTDLLNSHLNNMLLVSHPQQASEADEGGGTALISANQPAAPSTITDADTELHLATESITDPLLVDRNFQPTQRIVVYDLPEVESEDEQVPDDPTCRAARTSLSFDDIVQRKRPQQSMAATPPSKANASAGSSPSLSAGALGVGGGGGGGGSGAMAGTIAGLRDPVAALRLPPDMAGLLAPTTDLNLLLQEDSGLQVLLLDGSESQAYAESTINLRDLE